MIELFNSHQGEFAALLTAVFWTITALSFETASKRMGSLNLNLIRLAVAFVLLSLFSWIRRNEPFPMDAGAHQWFWLVISGIVGFVIGDYCLFQAFIILGARISMLIMTLSPLFAAVTGWIFLHDTLSIPAMMGMILTLAGIMMVTFVRVPAPKGISTKREIKLALPVKGIILALIAAFGQGLGLVISKLGMQHYDPFSSAQIRVLAGFLGFVVIFTFLRKWKGIPAALSDRKGMLWLTNGAIFGPFLGVSFSLIAVQFTNAGIAQTIMSLVPVMIIPPSVIFLKEKPKKWEIIGAFCAVSGVALFFF